MPSSKHSKDVRAVFIGFVLIALIGVYFIGRAFLVPETNTAANRDTQTSSPLADAPVIKLETLQQKIRNGDVLTFIDIRSGQEYQSEHIAGSLSFPGGDVAAFVPEKNASVIVVYAPEDPISVEIAQNILSGKSSPYFFLEGGFPVWKNAGHGTLSYGDPYSFVDHSKITFLSPTAFLEQLKTPGYRVLLLDVQSPENYRKAHLLGAVNIPLADLERRVGEIPPAKPVVVYGENELASFQAAVRLFDLNILGVRALEGNDVLKGSTGLKIERVP